MEKISIKVHKTILYCLISIFICTQYGFTQSISIDHVEIDGPDVLIFYNLADENPENTYTVNLYTSIDDYLSPAKNIEGDAGLQVRTGANRKIIWHAAEELGDLYKGRVALEVKGRIYVPFVAFDAMKKTYKRGKPQTVAWSGGSSGTVLTWELYNKNEELVHTFPPVPNVGNYEMIFPKDLAPGKDFRFRVSDSRNRDDVVYTSTFSVSRKIPLLAKGVAAVALVAIIYSLKDVISPEDETIPLPADLN